MTVIRAIVLLFISLIIYGLAAQTCVPITIIDQRGEPILFAQLTGTSTAFSLQTDAHGRACLPAGVDSVRIVSAFAADSVVALNQVVDARIILRSILLATAEVRANRILTDEGYAFTPEVMQRIPAIGGEVDALRSLQVLPSVQTQAEGQAAPAVRGGTVDQTLVLMDGAVLYSPNHLLGFMGSVNAEAVQDMRVYPGRFPARYGGRLSGVLAVTTKQGRRDRHAGSFAIGFPNSNIRLEGPAGKGSYFAASRLAYPAIGLFATGGVFLQGDLNARFTYPLPKGDKLSVATYISQDYINAAEPVDVNEERGKELLRSRYGWGNQLVSARYIAERRGWLTESGLTASRYVTGSGASIPNPASENRRYRTEVKTQRNSLALWGIANRQVGRDRLELSARVEVGRYGLNVAVPTALSAELPSADFELANPVLTESSLGVQYQWAATKRLTFDVGGRLHALTTGGDYQTIGFEPRLSAKVDFGKLSASLAYDRMRQPLHRVDPWAFEGYFEVFLPPSEAYPVQGANQYSIQMDAPLPTTSGSIRASAYYKNFAGLPLFSSGAEVFSDLSVPDPDIPVGKGYAYGAELFTTGRIRDIDYMLGYAYARSFRSDPESRDGPDRYLEYRYSRPHQLSANASYAPEDWPWSLSANFTYSTGFLYTIPSARLGRGTFVDWSGAAPLYDQRRQTRSPDHHRLDLAMTYTKKRTRFTHRWTASIYNAYFRKNPFYVVYAGSSYRTAPLSYDASALFRWVPGVQWSVSW